MPRLGLALSGGGLRATLFHLGVVRFLRDAGLLGEVTHIVSVSGGSILGAHLALNWGRYNGSAADFEEAASKIVAFVQSDARNQIARRIPFLVPLRFLRRFAFRGIEPDRHADGAAREAVCQAPLWRRSRASAPGSAGAAPPHHEHERGGPLLVHEGRPDHAASDQRGNQGRDPPGPADAGRAGGHGLLGLSRVLPPRADHGRRSRPLRGRVPAADVHRRRRVRQPGCPGLRPAGEPRPVARSDPRERRRQAVQYQPVPFAGHDRPVHAGLRHPLGSRRAARAAEVPGRSPLPVRGGPGPGRPQGRSHGAPPGDPVGGRPHPDGPRSFLAAGYHRTGAARLLRGPQAVPDPPRPLRVEPTIHTAVGPDEGLRRGRLAARPDGPPARRTCRGMLLRP